MLQFIDRVSHTDFQGKRVFYGLPYLYAPLLHFLTFLV